MGRSRHSLAQGQRDHLLVHHQRGLYQSKRSYNKLGKLIHKSISVKNALAQLAQHRIQSVKLQCIRDIIAFIFKFETLFTQSLIA